MSVGRPDDSRVFGCPARRLSCIMPTLADVSDGAALGISLARRHASAGTPTIERAASLLNYAELSRTCDWSLRSALTRLAQPEPVRSARVLDLVRRCDYALSGVQSGIERHPAVCDRRLGIVRGELEPEANEPHPDVRSADLARLIRACPDAADALVAGYESESMSLDDVERSALPLLVGALALDDLADTLADWASRGAEHPPLDVVDDVTGRVSVYFDQIGVSTDTGPPWRGRRR